MAVLRLIQRVLKRSRGPSPSQTTSCTRRATTSWFARLFRKSGPCREKGAESDATPEISNTAAHQPAQTTVQPPAEADRASLSSVAPADPPPPYEPARSSRVWINTPGPAGFGRQLPFPLMQPIGTWADEDPVPERAYLQEPRARPTLSPAGDFVWSRLAPGEGPRGHDASDDEVVLTFVVDDAPFWPLVFLQNGRGM